MRPQRTSPRELPRRPPRPASVIVRKVSNAPDRDYVARQGSNSGDGGGERFEHRRHVMAVGMEKVGRARHDPDMAFPEDEVAAPKRRAWLDPMAQHALLHVGV